MPARIFKDLFSTLDQSISDAQMRQLLFIYGFSVVGLILLPALAAVYWAHGKDWLAMLNMAVFVLVALNLVWLHKRKAVVLGENALLFGLFTILMAALFASIDHSGPFWFAAFPATAFFLKGLKRGAVAVALLLASLVAVIVLQEAGLVTTDLTTTALLLLCLSLATISALIGLSLAILIESEQRIARRSAALSQEILERHSVETLLRKSEEQLRFMAHRDTVTGLPKRALAQDRLERTLLMAERYRHQSAVLLLDIDNFTAVNLQHGHEFGDKVLRAMAERLESRLRASDTLARAGIDEFLVILSEISTPAAAAEVATALQQAVAEPLEIDGARLELSVSIGSALYPADGSQARTLLRIADERLGRIRQAAVCNLSA